MKSTLMVTARWATKSTLMAMHNGDNNKDGDDGGGDGTMGIGATEYNDDDYKTMPQR